MQVLCMRCCMGGVHATLSKCWAGSVLLLDREPKKGGMWICREELAARKAHKVCIWCAMEGHISKDCPNEKIAEMALPASHLGSLC